MIECLLYSEYVITAHDSDNGIVLILSKYIGSTCIYKSVLLFCCYLLVFELDVTISLCVSLGLYMCYLHLTGYYLHNTITVNCTNKHDCLLHFNMLIASFF